MISRTEYESAVRRTLAQLEAAGIFLSEEERTRIEVVDFGLGNLLETGLQLFTYVSTKRCCAKELVLFPGQTCAEHWHPPFENDPGKEETFRCRVGLVHLFVEGLPTASQIQPPEGVYTVFHEIILRPGDQHIIYPGTKHWFKAGKDGAVISEFSTRNSDEYDQFSDPRITRTPEIGPDNPKEETNYPGSRVEP